MNRTAYAMLTPLVGLFLLVAAFPLLRAVWWAFHGRTVGELRFVGIDHFSRILGDRVLLFALVNTLAFTLTYVMLLVPLAVGLAMALNRPGIPGRSLMRTMLFSTHLVGAMYVAVLIGELLARDSGPLAWLLPAGFDPLAQPWLAMPIVLVASLWMSAGYATVYVLAALQSVDADLVDAARMDGATGTQVFLHVTLPALKPTLAFVALTACVAGLQLFELPFLLFAWGSGASAGGGAAGPGNAALTLSMYLFSIAFEQGDFGYATAIGWVLALCVSVLSLLLLQTSTQTSLLPRRAALRGSEPDRARASAGEAR
jgi:ABC-type sugar transport system permease subunit